jgi:hypothetical protein
LSLFCTACPIFTVYAYSLRCLRSTVWMVECSICSSCDARQVDFVGLHWKASLIASTWVLDTH